MLRKHVPEVVVSLRNLCEKVGVDGGRGVGRRGKGSARKGGRGYKRRREMGVGEGSGGRGGGGNMQVEVQRGESNVSSPLDQSMRGLWR